MADFGCVQSHLFCWGSDTDDLPVGRVSKPSVGAADVTPSPEMPKLGLSDAAGGANLQIC